MEDIVDKETKEGISWSAIFFRLHHYCHLNKWDIYEYTLPQITELLKCVDKHIEFQVQITTAPFGGLTGGNDSTSSSSDDDTEYHEITEDGIGQLAKVLGGG